MEKKLTIVVSSIFVLLGSYFSTKWLMPFVKKFGEDNGIIDNPDSRKQHVSPKVRIGSISILTGYLIGLIISLIFDQTFLDNQIIQSTLIISFILFLLGLFDDIFTLEPFSRLFIQILSSFFLWNSGLKIETIKIDFLNIFTQNLPIYLSIIFTTIWIVGIINCINWFDGLDGLAGGTASIAIIAFTFINIFKGELLFNPMSWSLIGSIIAFLYFNKYPSKILMGDGGSYFIGINISVLSIYTFTNYSNNQSYLEIIYPLFILFIPLFDMLFVIISRIYKRKSIFYPDRSHFHHRLLDQNISHYKSVNYILFSTFWFSLAGIISYLFKTMNWPIFVSATIIYIFIARKILKIKILNIKSNY